MADEHYSIPAEPKYREQIRKLQNSDPADADKTLNPLIEMLIENTAAVKKQADGVEEVRPITGDGAPTPETAGHVGQHYFDKASGIEYVCKQVNEDGTFVWEEAGNVLVDDAGPGTRFRLGVENGRIYIQAETVEEEV